MKHNHTNKPPFPPWGSVESWQEANLSLDFLIKHHPKSLDKAKVIADNISLLYQRLSSPMSSLCGVTCNSCTSPCCPGARPYFDFKDLIFFHLSHTRPPEAQTIKEQADRCRYISIRGCTLPRLQRPWICTWYICSRQQPLLSSNREFAKIPYIIAEIKDLRGRLEDEFILTVSPCSPKHLAKKT